MRTFVFGPVALRCLRSWQAWFGMAVLMASGLGWTARPVRAQETVPAATAPYRGLELRSISAYAVYYSNTMPGSGGFQALPTQLGADIAMGGSAQIGWMRTGQHSTFSLVYTPSYTGRVRYSSWNALNHALSLNAARRIARWDVRFSVSADLSNFEGFLFSPTAFDNVASAAPNSADLSAAVLGQPSGNTQVSAILNSAPVVESAARALLYGERVFTSAAQATVSYSFSPRLSLNFSGGTARNQHLDDNQNSSAQSLYLLPDTTSGNASMGLSYSLSPRTQLGAAVTTSRVMSDLYDGYSTTSTASLGRTLGRRWFVQAHGGMGVMHPVRETGVQASGPHPVWGGSVGFRTYAHTFLGAYDRTVSDAYGVGVNATSTSSASWRWNRPRRTWWLSGSLNWQQLQGTASQAMSNWRTAAGWGRTLTTHLAALAEYAYLNYSGGLGTAFYSRSQSAVRFSIVWDPDAGLAR